MNDTVTAARKAVEDKTAELRIALDVLRQAEGKPADQPCSWCCNDDGTPIQDPDTGEVESPDCFACRGSRRRPLTWPWVVTGATIGRDQDSGGAADLALRPCAMRRGVKWVSVRPVQEQYGGKTYLGILLGELPLSLTASLDRTSGVMTLEPTQFNPAIYVPDLHRVICGIESWWGAIKTPADLRKISDDDINNAWYVRALAELTEKATGETTKG